MRAKDFFMLVRQAPAEIRRLRARAAKYREMGTNITGGLSDVVIRTLDVHSRVESAAVELVTVADMLAEQAEQYVALVKEAERVIPMLESSRHRQVLSLRYIERKDWETVAAEMGYSDVNSAHHCHGWALRAAEKHLQSYVCPLKSTIDL